MLVSATPESWFLDARIFTSAVLFIFVNKYTLHCMMDLIQLVNISDWMSLLSGDQGTNWQVYRIQEISPM